MPFLALLLIAIPVPAVAKAPHKPKLIVTLVVDQFAGNLFQRYRPTYSHGMRRLSDGVAFVEGYQSQAATETCPGHSTILTGRYPAATGIVANGWYDRTMGKSVYCVAVPGADPQARGPENLRVDTLGTWLKASEPGSQVISVSGKDRAAIMLAGHHADAVYWWQDGKGFGTSLWAGPDDALVTGPAQKFDRPLLATWRRSPPALWPTEVSTLCASLERREQFGTVDLSGHVPPDGSAVKPDDKAFAGQLHASPLFDELALSFAGHLIDARRLGRGSATDLLAVSLSATDYIGHIYGNGGPEMCAQMAALDLALGAFFQHLDALKVPYVVVLTADHGSSDAPERARENGLPADRIDGRALIEQLNAHLKQALGVDVSLIAGDDPQELRINVGKDPELYANVLDESIRWLKRQPHVAQVLNRTQVAAAAPPRSSSPEKLTMAERLHESFDPARSGDVFVVFDRYVTPFVPRAPGSPIAGHGTPWDYDRLVPILFWWPGVVGETVTRPVEAVDIAPTLATIAAVRTPLLDGKCLPEVAPCRIPIH